MTDVPQPSTCATCQGEGRLLHFYSRGPTSPPGNTYVGCPDCEAGTAYSAALAAEVASFDARPVPTPSSPEALARTNWNADRETLRRTAPDWHMPPWSRAPAWRRRPYILAAKEGKHPDAVY